jgi:hypothetical protein
MAKLKIHPKAFKLENTFFESQKMIDYALRTEGHQIFIYDEARESLQASKRNVDQQNILDFLNEAGQKNNCYFLVISDFYILKEEVAVGRAELLINCYKEYEQRQVDLFGDGNKIKVMDMQLGFFKLYNDQAKNLMFDIYRTTHRKDYNYVKPTFPPGRFVNQYACDEAAYRKMKQDALARFSSKHEKIDKRDIKLIEQNKKLLDIAKRFMKHQEIADELNVSRVNITTKYKNMAPTSIFDNKPPTEYSS